MAASALIINDGNVVAKPSPPESTDAAKTNKEHRSAVLHRSLHHDPLRVVSAKGNYLQLDNGQKIFDATGGAAVACIGHGDQRYGTPITRFEWPY
jgi:adenosylmethionine-8-amino-7-oxononanoate aminotransferase